MANRIKPFPTQSYRNFDQKSCFFLNFSLKINALKLLLTVLGQPEGRIRRNDNIHSSNRPQFSLELSFFFRKLRSKINVSVRFKNQTHCSLHLGGVVPVIPKFKTKIQYIGTDHLWERLKRIISIPHKHVE